MTAEQVTVAVIDGGGRGHVLAEAYAKSPHVGKVLVFPGNDFMTHPTKPIISYAKLTTTSVAEIVAECVRQNIVLVDVAQDAAIEQGLADATREAGIATVGPSREAGRIEWDKAWARNFMHRAGIPQPKFHVFTSSNGGKDFLKSLPDQRWFVKAAGLAEGKGAFPAYSNEEAQARIDELQRFKRAGETFLLEEWLEGDNGQPGEEFSAFAYCDGKNWKLVGYAQDHKRALDGDKGENTGGMGCSTPPYIVDAYIDAQTQKIFSRIFKEFQREGIPYQGVLYFGGMVVQKKGKPTVYAVECNARWGDPEAEVIIPGIETDFFELNMAAAEGRLDNMNIHTDGKTRVSVAVASQGYPGDYSEVKGRRVSGLEETQQLPGVRIFGAGLRRNGEGYVVNGGRIVHIVAEGSNTSEANRLANNAADLIHVEGALGENLAIHRRDIGHRDIQRLVSTG